MSYKNEKLKKTNLKTEIGKKSYQKPQLKKYKAIKKIVATTVPIGITEI